jgi:hypothetical protein
MQTWKWLYKPPTPPDWRFVRRVILKAVGLFVLVNLLFAAIDPLPLLARLSGYNILFPGRDRLPYGENPDISYNLSLYQLEAMFASHDIAAPGRDRDYRVLFIGDSSVWGILLKPEETLTGQINAAGYVAANGQRIRAYNLGYPTMSLTKDLMLLDYAMRYQPDLVVWSFTLESFERGAQLDSAIVQNNPDRVRHLISTFDLRLNPEDMRFVALSFWDRLLVNRRRPLADLLRLQLYGVPWSITGIDQEYRTDYTPRAVDLPADATWHGLDETTFTPNDLAFDVLAAGVARTGRVPILLINEPMFLSSGENSAIRYNAFFPRWVYDEYRRLLHEHAAEQGWDVIDLWDALPGAECYTDSAVHLTTSCSAQLSGMVGQAILTLTETNLPGGLQ